MKHSQADILAEFGPIPGVEAVHGVTYDGQRVWFATGDSLRAIDPASGDEVARMDVPGHAGSAFDGRHIFQIVENEIWKIDPQSGETLGAIPTPSDGVSGMAWAEGALWVGEYRAGRIHQVDPETGAVLRVIECKRLVTGVTWVDGELWHGVWEGEDSELRRIDPQSGEGLERIEMPPGVRVSGLESDGEGRFFCGGGPSGKVRVVRRPGR